MMKVQDKFHEVSTVYYDNYNCIIKQLKVKYIDDCWAIKYIFVLLIYYVMVINEYVY